MENISILIVEAKKSDAEHIERRLKELEYSICAVVSTGAEAVEKAAEMQPDVVLINVELEGEMDGIETAKQIRDSLDIPTVYLADYSNDAFSEKTDLLKRAEITNPFDYIPLPHGRRRLYLTIESTVYQHRMERETKLKEQQLSTILNSISDAVIATDDKESVIFMNPAAERLTGWGLEEAAGVNIKQIFQIDTEGDCSITTVLRNMLDTDTAVSPELPTDAEVKDNTVFTSKSGRKTHIDYSIAPSINQKGEVIGTVITFRDITDYKALEEQLNQTIDQLQDQTQLMETIFDSMSDGIIAADTEGRYLITNPKAHELTNISLEDIPIAERPERYGFFHPDGKTLFSEDELPLVRSYRGETTDNIEMFVSSDSKGDGIFINISGRPLLDKQGNLKGGVVVFRDTTELKATQTKLEQTVSKARTQNQLMETVFNSMHDGVIVLDSTGQPLFVNPSLGRICGPEPRDVDRSEWSEAYGIFYPDKKTCVPTDQMPITRALQGKEISDEEFFVRNEHLTDGLYVMSSAFPLFDENQQIIGSVGIVRDITKEKAAEAELEQTMEELQNQTQLMETIFNSISDGVMAVDTDGQYLMVNARVEEMVGPLSAEISIADRPKRYGLFHPDGKTLFPGDELPITRALRGETTDNIEMLVSNDTQAEKIFININGRPLLDGQGNLKGGVIVFRDTTELKAAQTELEQTFSELRDKTQLMETVFDSMSDGIAVISVTGQVMLVNPSIKRMLGTRPLDKLPSNWSETYGVFYPDKERHIPIDQFLSTHIFRGEAIRDKEIFVRNEVQTEGINVMASGLPLFDENREVIGCVAILRDITESKVAEAQLEQTMQELQNQVQLTETVFNSISDGVVVTDEAGNFLLVNPSAERIVGMGATDTPSDEWSEAYGTFYPDKVTPFPNEKLPLIKAMQGQVTDEVDLFMRNPENPEGCFINVTGRPLQDERNSVRGGVIVFRDVTKTKRTEARLEQTVNELEDQTQLMDIIFNNMSDGVVVADDKGQYIMANPAAEQIVGQGFDGLDLTQASEQYGLFDLTTGTLFPTDQLPLSRALRGKLTDNTEMRIKNPQLSQEVYTSVNGRPLLDENGVSRGGVVVFRDITKLKQTQIQLENQTQLLETVFNNMSDGVIVADENGEYIMANPSAEQMTGQGYDNLDLPQSSEQYGLFDPITESLFTPDRLPLARAVKGESTDNIEMCIRNPQLSQEVYVSVNGRPLLDENGVSRGGVVVAHNITELKQTQIQLENQTQLLETVFNNISDGVIVADENGEYIMANPAAEQMNGRPFDEMELSRASEQYGVFDPTTGSLFPADQLPLTRAVRGESTNNVEMQVKNEYSSEIYLSINGRPLLDEKGVSRGGVVVAHNITELKQTQIQLEQTITELENQSQLLEVVFNNMSDGVVVADDQGRYVMYNQTAEQMTGQRLEPMDIKDAPQHFGFFFPDKKTTFPADQLPLARALHGEESDNVNLFMHNPKMPEGLHLSISARPLRNAQGVVTGGVSVSRDVTDLRLAEIELKSMVNQLEDQGNLMESIFNSISDGVVVADEHGAFTIFNPSAEKIIGMGAVDTASDEWSDTYGLFFPDRVTLFPPDELPLALALKGKASDDVEMFVRNPNVPDGVFISVSGRPIRDETGTDKGGVAVFRDVTHQVIAEEALMQAFAQGRLEIVETILHNIGNAINSVTVGINVLQENLVGNQLVNRLAGLADMVKAHKEDWVDFIENDWKGQQVLPFMIALAADFTDQNERVVKTLERVSERVTHIIDIIRTQRSSNQSSMTRKTIDLRQAIWSAVKLQQDSIDKRGIQVDVDCENAPQEITIQESQFQQMLVNLLKNSIEATDELIQSGGLNETPRIEVKAYIDEDFLYLDITDNGIGIAPKDSKLIFNAGYTTKELGTGLGLHSSANFVIGSGGQIHALSEGIGKGATMRIMMRCSSVMS